MTPTGFEQLAPDAEKSHSAPTDSAPNSAFSDDLQRVIDGWPHLKAAARNAILKIVAKSETKER